MFSKLEGTCWIRQIAFENLIKEAQNKYPLETGGIFIGHQANHGKDLVVTDIIGPGPNALHKPCGYLPDVIFQEKEIAKLYGASKQLHTYLGDWHTHPQGKALLSSKDKKVLQRIAKYKDARIAHPIMGILSIMEEAEFLVWRYVEKKFWCCSMAAPVEMSVKLFD